MFSGQKISISFGHVLALLLFLTTLGCSPDHQEQGIVISVGESRISIEQLRRDLRRTGAGLGITDQELSDNLEPFVDRIIEEYLILEYGRAEGISLTERELETAVREVRQDYPEHLFNEMLLQNYIDLPEWKEELRRQLLLKKIIQTASDHLAPVTLREIREYYEDHKEEFRYGERVRFRQIITRKRADAEGLLKRLEGEEKFADLVREFASGNYEDQGEWIARGILLDPMDKELFSLPPGKVSRIVETPYGFHLFEVLEKRPEGFKSLPEAKEEIERRLSQQHQEGFYQEWIKKLRSDFKVQVNQKRLKGIMEIG